MGQRKLSGQGHSGGRQESQRRLGRNQTEGQSTTQPENRNENYVPLTEAGQREGGMRPLQPGNPDGDPQSKSSGVMAGARMGEFGDARQCGTGVRLGMRVRGASDRKVPPLLLGMKAIG